jgi:biofilm PGA synthesis N-glycosyltransferase PgaC
VEVLDPVEPARPGTLALDAREAPGIEGAAAGGARAAERRRFYISVAAKFAIATAFSVAWTTGGVWLSLPWLRDLRADFGLAVALAIVCMVAYVPAGLMSFMAASLILDRQPKFRTANPTTGVSIIIAARNEEKAIADTIRYAACTDYDGPVTIVLADNGSTDATVAIALATAEQLEIDLKVVHEAEPGKANALNHALATIDTPYVVTVDADTLLHTQALRRLVMRMESAPPDTVAVAGAVLVRNSRVNLLTRVQEWDYYLGIAAVKRMQGLYQSTLVAQGAFSLYRTEAVMNIGGWPDAIGEDIVVTWRLMADGARVLTEPTAIAFTDVPVDVRHFMRQRIRWARGMIEALRSVPPWRQRRPLSKVIAGIDLLIPLLDIGYGLIWLPGLLLALLGYPIIVGVWTLTVLPVTILVYAGLRRYQHRRVFAPLGLRVRKNRFGYLAFLLGYQALCSTASLVGYGQELRGARRRWK